jgi:hypothetical protein
MKNKGCLIVGVIVAIPLFYVFAYVMFPSVRPKPTPAEVFSRVTHVSEPPSSMTDLKIHFLFNPLLGDGGALISFKVSEADGRKLASKLTFEDGDQIPSNPSERFSHIPIEIADAEYARYDEGMLHSGVVKTNADRTIFVWDGSF